MPGLRHLTRLAAATVATGLIVAACGGSASSPTSGAEASAAPVEASSAAPSEAPASEAPAASAEPTLGAIPTFDLSALSGAIPGVDSYRTSTSVGGVKQYDSVVITKPVLSKSITVYDDAGSVATRYVIIGKDAWTAEGAAGSFDTVPAALAGSMLVAYDPAIMLGAFAQIDWAHAAADQGSEQKNGIQARHIKIDSTSFVGAGGAMPAGSAIDVWVADAGYLVAWEMTGFPENANFSIEVTNVNDPANKVDKPS